VTTHAGGFTFRVDNRGILGRKVREAAARGLSDAAEMLLDEANQIVPHQEGTLEGSGTASVDATNLRAAVSYDTPYALRQHEDTRLSHPGGRQAKYLERTFQQHGPKAAEHIAAEMRKALD
jgi:hypothetical protein